MIAEHAFGILKNRWQTLKDCRLTCRAVRDEARFCAISQACLILHNLLLGTWKDSLTATEVEEVMSIRGGVTETGEEPQDDRRDKIVMEMIRDEVRRDLLLTSMHFRCERPKM